MSRVGIVGAGVMGAGVADNAARCGHDIVVFDVDPAASRAALERIERDCRLSRLITGHAVDAVTVVSRISVADDLLALRDCEIVVENVPEKWDLKRAVYAELDRVCSPETIFVVNTSAIPITRVGSVTQRPDRIIGVHFMNPVPMKTAVELIPGRLTSEDTVKRIQEFLASLGKEPILIKDSCGFVSNRILMLTINEAAFLVYEGNATAATVDDVFRRCFGHPTGPLETADLIGVDTVLNSIEVLYGHFADSKYRPCPLLREMVAAGLHGRKSGCGFYSYDSAALSPGVLGT